MEQKQNAAARLLHSRRGRGVLRAVVIALTAVGLLLVNFVWFRSVRAHNFFLDLTPEEMYTLSDAAREELDGIDRDVTITFCAAPDALLSDETMRYVYTTALAMRDRNAHISVRTVDLVQDPGGVQEYKNTSLTRLDSKYVIVSHGSRYRTLDGDAFWGVDSETRVRSYYLGEYKLLTAILSVTAVNMPLVCFTTGHGEYNPAEHDGALFDERGEAFYRLMSDVGLTVRYIDLDREEIPADCVLLVMNGPTVDYGTDDYPTKDYAAGETTTLGRLDRYLCAGGALMVFRDPFAPDMPALDLFLADWGIAYERQKILDPRSALIGSGEGADSDRATLVGQYVTDAGSIGYSLYSDVAGLTSPPKTVIADTGSLRCAFRNTVEFEECMYAELFRSSDSARAYDAEGLLLDRAGSYTLGAVTVRRHQRTTDVNSVYSYVVAFATTELSASSYLSDPSYANYDVMYSILRTVSRTDVYSSLGALDPNSKNFGGKHLQSTAFTAQPSTAGRTAFILLGTVLPCTALLVCAVAVTRRRRNR